MQLRNPLFTRRPKRWAKMVLPAVAVVAATLGAQPVSTAAAPHRQPQASAVVAAYPDGPCFGSADAAERWLSSRPAPRCADAAQGPPFTVDPNCFGSAEAAERWLASGPRPACAS